MRLKISRQFHIQPGLAVCLSDQLCLGFFARLGYTASCVAVLIGTRRPDQSSDCVSMPYRVRETLKDYDSKTFTSAIPIGTAVKAVAPAIFGEKAHIRQRNVQLRRADYVRPSNYSLAPVSLFRLTSGKG